MPNFSSPAALQDPGAELRVLMARFPQPDPTSLRPSNVSGFVRSLDSVMDNLRSTHARLEARVALNAARESELGARERALAAEEAALRAAANSAASRHASAEALLKQAAVSFGELSRTALDASASATYNFEEQFGNLVRANQARERGFSASVALDVTNSVPRAGVSEWSARVASGGGMKTAQSPTLRMRGPPPSPMRLTASQTRLRNPHDF